MEKLIDVKERSRRITFRPWACRCCEQFLIEAERSMALAVGGWRSAGQTMPDSPVGMARRRTGGPTSYLLIVNTFSKYVDVVAQVVRRPVQGLH